MKMQRIRKVTMMARMKMRTMTLGLQAMGLSLP